MAKQLLKSRTRIMQNLENLHEFSGHIKPDTSIEFITVRIEALNNLWSQFFDIESRMTDDVTSMMDEFTEMFFETKAAFVKFTRDFNKLPTEAPHKSNDILDKLFDQQRLFLEGLTERTASILNSTIANNSAGPGDIVRLPKISIEPFRGNYDSWPGFIDLYTSTIHDNGHLSNVHKFQLLKGLLRDGPADLLKDFLITDANYEIALQKLKDRYSKKKVILSTLVSSFLNQPNANNGQAKTLRHLCDFSDEILKGMKALGSDAEKRDPWLLHILLQKLDTETQEAWSLESVDNDFPNVDDFLKFINKRCDVKESCALLNKKPNIKSISIKAHHTSESESIELKCPHCSKSHFLYRCLKFKQLSVNDRLKLAQKYVVCYNCLKFGHDLINCTVQTSCRYCQKKHHSLLHVNNFSHPRSTSSIQSSPSSSSSSSSSTTSVANSKTQSAEKSVAIANNPNSNFKNASHNSQISLNTSIQGARSKPRDNLVNSNSDEQCLNAIETLQTLLPTALVNVRDVSGKLQPARILIDTASTASFVSEKFVKRLGLRKTSCSRSITGIGSTPSGTTKGIVALNLHSRYDSDHQIIINALILNKVTSLIPSEPADTSNYDLQTFHLADPTFHIPADIDILLGAERALHILTGKKHQLSPTLIAVSTIFGYIIGGLSSVYNSNTSSFNSCCSVEASNINFTLQQFWKLEEIPNHPNTSNFDSEIYFLQTTHINSENKFVVKLPFVENHPVLGNSIKAAYSRLFAMERKFNRNPCFAEEYKRFMSEYLALGHMSKIPLNEIVCPETKCYYLPHHGILKSESLTTKLRVVFDGSCQTSTGTSLNDVLRIGPTIQPDLVLTLIRFRLHSIVYTSDVEKMYRQVLVNESDRNFQRIVWRKDSSQKIIHYRLNTVTYGTSAAPYLAIRALQMVADDKTLDKNIAALIKSDFYVDDFLSGSANVRDAQHTIHKLSTALENHGFFLRKWRSNSLELLKLINPSAIESDSLHFKENDESTKTLGLHWNPTKDAFFFRICLPDNQQLTKRKLLSEIARTFDPLGWLSPVTITMKSIMQQLWTEHTNWDDILDDRITKQWSNLKAQLFHIQSIDIPRSLFHNFQNHTSEFHAFCDASKIGYASVIYIRTVNYNGVVCTRMIMAKTKVAPLKPLTIPKMELSGAVLLVNMLTYLKTIPEFANISTTAWCDSQIVLAWLSSVPSKWEQFVANRCAKILDILPRSNWEYIRSTDNPADVASRGIHPKDLPSSNLWWNGPKWLCDDPISWPRLHVDSFPEADVGYKKSSTTATFHSETSNCNDTLEQLFTNCSSFEKIRGIITRILQLLPRRVYSQTTLSMNRQAENICFRYIQQTSFSDEIQSILKNSQFPKKSKLLSLTPFLCEQNLLRVGGRLKNADISIDSKHPIILPRNHVVSQLIIRDAHIRYLHSGPTLLTNILKQKYWIVDCKNLTRRIVNKCIQCIKQRAISRTQLMGDLPRCRITESRPFLFTGVDFAGPMYLKSRSGRGNIPMVKAYVALFICRSTKAIHLELVSAMTTEAYIAALRRFISRRGIPAEIQSDNGSNFLGAKHDLHELYKLSLSQEHNVLISSFLSQNEIKFTFIPPSSPHFGGLWESNIKCMKYHLKRVCNTTLVYEEMTTLLHQIESLLNSRPLVPLSNDVDDIDVLTPGHFLIGAPLTLIPEPDITYLPEGRLSRWQNIQARVQSFWKRWSLEYLNNLQQRRKWQTTADNFKIGDLVIVKENHLSPSHWVLGRITKLLPGPDELVRVVEIKTKNGEIKRPIVKLCQLLTDPEDVTTINRKIN